MGAMRAGLMIMNGEGDGKGGLEEGGGLMGRRLDCSNRAAMAMDIGFLRGREVCFRWSTEDYPLFQ